MESDIHPSTRSWVGSRVESQLFSGFFSLYGGGGAHLEGGVEAFRAMIKFNYITKIVLMSLKKLISTVNFVPETRTK